jgi:subtilisin family serine protease
LLIALESRALDEPGVAAAYDGLASCLEAVNRGDGTVVCAGTLPAAISVQDVEVDRTHVTVTWYTVGAIDAAVERRFEAQGWETLTNMSAGPNGTLIYRDDTVVAGGRYTYRLAVAVGGGVQYFGPVTVNVPGESDFRVMGARPNPATQDLVLAFSLANREPAKLDLIDITGRRVHEQALVGLGAGQHTLNLGATSRFRAGIYLVRVTQAGRRTSGKVTIVHLRESPLWRPGGGPRIPFASSLAPPSAPPSASPASRGCAMRRVAARLALATLASFPSAPLRADPARERIVFLAPDRGDATRADARAHPPAARLGALGLTLERSLDLGGARVWLIAARDSLAARSAHAALLADPAVAWVEPNRVRDAAVERVRPFPIAPAPSPPQGTFPNDPLFNDTRQWGLMNVGESGTMGGVAGADIRAREAWIASTGANHVVLAVADTGVDPVQPELQAPMPGGGWRMFAGANVTADASPSWADSFGHGTPVAAVMAARTHDGAHFDSLGMAGVCGGDGAANLGCRIVPIKIAPGRTGYATSFDIARGILHAVEQGARAVNVSFAGGGPSRLERLAMQHAITRGCVVVAAAGNRGGRLDGREPQYPAAYAADGLGVQVGASDRWDRRAPYSSFGPGLDLLAPGDDIWSAWMTYTTPGGATYPGYALVSGTSFAAPFATGTVGLLAALRPDLGDTDFQNLLRRSADDLGAPGFDAETGAGRLNAAAALERVRPGIGFWRDEIAGQTFTDEGPDTLALAEPGPGALAAVVAPLPVRRIAVTATVAIPDSFTGVFEAWPRVGGTFTMRGAGRTYFTPWAEVIAVHARAFTLRGYFYRDDEDRDEPRWLPLPPDQARFGFTVSGVVRREPVTGVPVDGGRERPRLRLSPNPFRGSVTIDAPPGSRVRVFDPQGRVVRRLSSDGTMRHLSWDGRDDRGSAVRPGLYFVRCDHAAGFLHARLVRLP